MPEHLQSQVPILLPADSDRNIRLLEPSRKGSVVVDDEAVQHLQYLLFRLTPSTRPLRNNVFSCFPFRDQRKCDTGECSSL